MADREEEEGEDTTLEQDPRGRKRHAIWQLFVKLPGPPTKTLSDCACLLCGEHVVNGTPGGSLKRHVLFDCKQLTDDERSQLSVLFKKLWQFFTTCADAQASTSLSDYVCILCNKRVLNGTPFGTLRQHLLCHCDQIADDERRLLTGLLKKRCGDVGLPTALQERLLKAKKTRAAIFKGETTTQPEQSSRGSIRIENAHAQSVGNDIEKSNELLVHACNCDALRCIDPTFRDFCPHMKRFLRSACWASHNEKWLSYRIATATAELFAYHSLHCRRTERGGCNVPLCDELRVEEHV